MFDTMTTTKVVGAVCGSLLVFLLVGWAAESIFSMGGEHGEEAQAYSVPTDDGAAAPAATEAAPVDVNALIAAADVAAGEKTFAKCKACHKIDGANATGPHLNGVVNRAKGSVPDFGYSDAILALKDQSWTPENLFGFLENPKGYMPGTKMSFAGLAKPEDRANVIAYLETLK